MDPASAGEVHDWRNIAKYKDHLEGGEQLFLDLNAAVEKVYALATDLGTVPENQYSGPDDIALPVRSC
jgi:hypothetical protein